MPDTIATPEKETIKVTDVQSAQKAFLGLMEPPEPPKEQETEDKEEKEVEAKDAKQDEPPEPEQANKAEPDADKDEAEQEQEQKADTTEKPEGKVVEKTDSETSDEEETELPGTLSELAEALDINVDDLRKSLRDKVNIDGEESELSLHEIRRGHLRESDYTRKTQELAKQREEFTKERDAKLSLLDQQTGRLTGLIMELEKSITKEVDIDWDKLREEDTAEYVRRKEDVRDRKAMLDEAIKEQKQLQQKQTEEQQKQLVEYLQNERKALLVHFPEWSDQDKAMEEQKRLATYLVGQGFSTEEVNSVIDHRQVVLINKAMLYDKMQKENKKTLNIVKKKINKVPSMVKSGSKEDKPDPNVQAIAERRKRLKRTGKIDDAAGVFLEMMEK